jgi:hypothetical protein
MKEGAPATKAVSEDAAHFLIRVVREHPHQVTIYAGGPMTNIALAISLDPHFVELARDLVFMGGSIDPQTDDPEFANDPQREFNLWFDPEAAHIVLRAPWASIVCTTVDVSVRTRFTKEMFEQVAKSQTPVAQYLAKYGRAEHSYLWDELAAAAWLDPSLITRERVLYMDVNLGQGPGYGNTVVWSDTTKPAVERPKVHAHMEPADAGCAARRGQQVSAWRPARFLACSWNSKACVRSTTAAAASAQRSCFARSDGVTSRTSTAWCAFTRHCCFYVRFPTAGAWFASRKSCSRASQHAWSACAAPGRTWTTSIRSRSPASPAPP